MADNTTLNTGSGGDTLRTEDRTTFKTPVSLIDVGGTSAESLIGDSGVTMPVGGLSAEGAAVSGNPVVIGGRYDATPRAIDDGDVGALAIDVDGALHISDGGNTITVDGTVTANLSATDNAVLDTIASNTSNLANCIIQDDSPFTPATGYLMMIGGEFDDAGTDSVDEGDAGNVRISANRNLYVQLRDAAGNERGLNVDANGYATVNVNGTVTVGSHAVTNAGTFAVQVDGTALTRLTDIETNTDFGATTGGGVEASALRVTIANDSTGVISVDDNGGALTVDNGGTFAVQVDAALPTGSNTIGAVNIAAAQTLATVTTLTGGGVAHDSADSGNPHKIGGKATTAQSGLTLVANADRTDAMFAADGSQLIRNVCLEDVVQERTTNTDGASTAFSSGLGAPGSGVRLWITNVDLCNTSGSDITVDLRDGAAGSVLWTLPVPAGGGVVKRFDPPLKLTANTALAFDASAATTTLTISANGYKSKL